MPVFYSSKFQNERGQWIYIQDGEQRANSYQIMQSIQGRWRPHSIYYHFRSGGHIEAVRHHLRNQFFLKADLRQFYNHVSRGKIIRCLIKIGFSYHIAHDFAMRSTVSNPNDGPGYTLPFGFVQSPLLATLVLQKSIIGKTLLFIQNKHKIAVSVYMDDILLSSGSETSLIQAKNVLSQAVDKAMFSMNISKTTAPLQALQIFNIDVSQKEMNVTDARMQDFIQKLRQPGNEYVRAGVIGYVHTVNPEQAKILTALADT